MMTASSAPPRNCGNCTYSDPIKGPIAHPSVECFGVPPTPVVIGMKQGLGGPEAAIELLRPRLQANARACALWVQKIEFIAPILPRIPNKIDG